MIPNIFIQNWSNHVKWQTPDQIEQDLIISRALVDLYNDPHIKDALVFRGGTALNKLFINPPSRYSEDIDNELINLNRVFDIFAKYCAYNDVQISREEFIKNLEQKKDNRDFHVDMSLLLPSKLHWNFDEAYQFVIDNVISRLP